MQVYEEFYVVNNRINKIMTDNEHFTMHKSLTCFTSGNTKRRDKMK